MLLQDAFSRPFWHSNESYESHNTYKYVAREVLTRRVAVVFLSFSLCRFVFCDFVPIIPLVSFDFTQNC